MTDPALRVISLGGGVQSSTLTLMLDRGALDRPPPDVAIWADTGNDPPEVAAMVGWLAANVSYEVVTVRADVDIVHGLSNCTDGKGNVVGSPIPTFTRGADGSRGRSRRFCTDQFKLRPIRKEIRRRLGVEPGKRVPKGVVVDVAIGFSSDEIGRIKDPPTGWEQPSYPLIDAHMTRKDCVSWWETNAGDAAPPLARSACVMCPYHSSGEWTRLQRDHPEMVLEAAAAEAAGQAVHDARGSGHYQHFLHRRRIPLMAALQADADQGTLFEPDSDCGGVCWT